MAKESSKSANGDALSTSEAIERIATMNGAAGEIFTEAVKAYFEGVAAWNDELMRFMKVRMDRDVALGGELTKCDNWQDAAKLQQSWMQQTTEEYLTEAGKLMELASKTATQQWAPIYERANKALDEVKAA